MKDVYSANEAFLEKKGMKLMPTGAYGTPYNFSNEEFYLSLSEFCNLSIYHKRTEASKMVNMATEILTDEDFDFKCQHLTT